jgi:Fic family protein
MIYGSPTLTPDDERVIEAVDALRTELRFYLRSPRRWYGTLRRSTFARAVQGSNSIEGYHASVEDVAAVIDGEEPLDADDETQAAIGGYRDAMTYVVQLAPNAPVIDASLLKSLHFMMLKYDLSKRPGQWRPGAVWVQNEHGDAVYEAPPGDEVDGLIKELLAQLIDTDSPPMIAAAMAHLNLKLIHPFSDGNGRMARCLQTFVLARDGVLAPEFTSIEEYLGRNTQAYYDVLSDVAEGSWSPQRSARPWLEFLSDRAVPSSLNPAQASPRHRGTLGPVPTGGVAAWSPRSDRRGAVRRRSRMAPAPIALHQAHHGSHRRTRQRPDGHA